MPTSAIRGAVLALGLLLTACGVGPHDDEAGGALDADVDVFTATVTLEIGEAEGDAAYLFGRVSGLALDADGRIYVADGQANEVRVFAPDGTHLFSFGRATWPHLLARAMLAEQLFRATSILANHPYHREG